MDNWLLPLIMIADVPKTSRAALIEQLLPVMLPGPSSQRLALAAIGAERQLKRQALNEQRLVEDVIKATKIKNMSDLGQIPALEAAFKRLPAAVQSALFPVRKP